VVPRGPRLAALGSEGLDVDPALQGAGRDEPGAALGDHHGSQQARAPARADRGCHQRRRDLLDAHGRRGRAAPPVHRGKRARRDEPGRLSSTFRSLGSYNYRLWAAGALVSNVGTWMQRTAQDWIVLAELTDQNAASVGIV